MLIARLILLLDWHLVRIAAYRCGWQARESARWPWREQMDGNVFGARRFCIRYWLEVTANRGLSAGDVDKAFSRGFRSCVRIASRLP